MKYMKMSDLCPPREVIDAAFYRYEISRAKSVDQVNDLKATAFADESLTGDEKAAIGAAAREKIQVIASNKKALHRLARQMAVVILSFEFLVLSFSAPAMDRYEALAQIETGLNDAPRCADVSRYGISPAVWRQYTALPLSAAQNSITALHVAQAVAADRDAAFAAAHHRRETPFEFYLLWHCPARLNHPNAADRDAATRFANLMQTR